VSALELAGLVGAVASLAGLTVGLVALVVQIRGQ